MSSPISSDMILHMRVKLSFARVRKSILIILILVGVFSGGYYLGVKGFKADVNKALEVKISRQLPPDKNVDFSLFWQVWDTLGSKYFDKSKLVPAEMVYGAIGGMVSALGDPYTMFLPPKENKVVDEDLSGSIEGVGIQLGYKQSRLAVMSPVPGSPAEKGGIKAGDFIAHITDVKRNIDIGTTDLTLTGAVQAIRGPSGTNVTITLVREGVSTPIVVELTRTKIAVPSVALTFVGKDEAIANIKVNKFSSETANEWETAVKQIISKPGTKGVIVDLRNNPGGYLQAAVTLASDFVPSGTVVVIQESGDGSRIEYKSEKAGRLQKIPVAVLVNGGSASASEILAGALRDKRSIKLIGEKSFGKGTVQEPIEIVGGSGLHVTTAKWLTPNGTWVHEKGLEPDITVELKDTDKEDVQLNAAIDALE